MNIAAITFFCVTPYAVLDFQRFAGEIKFIVHDVTRAWVDPEGQPVWLFYLTEHLRNGMGTVLALVSIAGLIYSFIRRSREDVLLVIFTLVSYITLAKGANFARYLIPTLPLLAIFAARFLDRALHFLELKISQPWARVICIFAVMGILIEPIMNIVRFDYWLTQPDTRQVATQWILSNIPPGSKIVIEGAGVLGPNVPFSRTDMEQALAAQPEDSLGNVYTKAILASQPLSVGYTVLSVFRLDEQHDGGYLIGTVASASYYSDLGYDYLVTSGWMQRDSTDTYSPVFQASLNKYYEPIKIFEPTVYFLFDPYAWRIDYQALRKVIPGQHGIGGPKLIIYKLREIKKSNSNPIQLNCVYIDCRIAERCRAIFCQ